jgi:hypothetical protein
VTHLSPGNTLKVVDLRRRARCVTSPQPGVGQRGHRLGVGWIDSSQLRELVEVGVGGQDRLELVAGRDAEGISPLPTCPGRARLARTWPRNRL